MYKMKFLVDADLPKSTARIIAEAGFEAKDVRNIGLGQSEDTEIVNYAQEKRCIIITRDLGFGEMFLYVNMYLMFCYVNMYLMFCVLR